MQKCIEPKRQMRKGKDKYKNKHLKEKFLYKEKEYVRVDFEYFI